MNGSEQTVFLHFDHLLFDRLGHKIVRYFKNHSLFCLVNLKMFVQSFRSKHWPFTLKYLVCSFKHYSFLIPLSCQGFSYWYVWLLRLSYWMHNKAIVYRAWSLMAESWKTIMGLISLFKSLSYFIFDWSTGFVDLVE